MIVELYHRKKLEVEMNVKKLFYAADVSWSGGDYLQVTSE